MDPILFTPAAGIFTMIFVATFYWMTLREDAGTPRMKEIASFIQEGANAFLRREFLTIAYFIVGLAILLLIVMPGWQIAFGFVFGALFSMLAILIGMNAAVRANVRTTHAARTNPGKALTVAFRGGSIMGLCIVALNLLGISILSIIFGVSPDRPENVSLLVGFGFGASLSSLFAQLGGGIYTKAADVGADLVGKVEHRIPEDDPRNAAVVADLVGDNVGDCAGRGADLFESGSDNLVSTMIMGLAFLPVYGFVGILFPLLTRSIGAVGAVLGALAVRGTGRRNPITAINVGYFTTGIFSLLTFFLLARFVMHDMRLFWCLTLGLLAALLISLIVQYYTGTKKPVKEMAAATQSGAAINLLLGLSYGMESTFLPLLVIAIVAVAAYVIMGQGILGFYGIAAAALGLTEMKGIIMASDAFGPIADNAGGIAEMSGLEEEVRAAGDVLDAAGNITKATTKGYGMACALLTSIAILFAYLAETARHLNLPFERLDNVAINLTNPVVTVGLMVGAAVPFLFSALAIRAVSRSAFKVVEEVRRQFREIKGLLAGEATPEYSRCVDITTKDALREMVWPTLVGVIGPIVIGFTLGVWSLAAFLLGTTIVGALLATFMFNSGGAWDNAKKYIEEGHFGGKGTDAHAAGVIGDTFGDPLKDTAGPSLHILIKLESILAITLLPLFIKYGIHW